VGSNGIVSAGVTASGRELLAQDPGRGVVKARLPNIGGLPPAMVLVESRSLWGHGGQGRYRLGRRPFIRERPHSYSLPFLGRVRSILVVIPLRRSQRQTGRCAGWGLGITRQRPDGGE